MNTHYAWLWMLSGASIAISSAAACLVHARRFRVSWQAYALGAGAWTASVALKFAAAIPLARAGYLGPSLPLPVSMLATGLLTGVFECGFTLALVLKTRLRQAPWQAALAFGLAFGCFEALLLAAPTFLAGLVAYFSRDIPPAEARVLLETVADWQRPLTLFHERLIAVPVHALAAVLIILAVQRKQWQLLAWAFLLKTSLDAVPAEGQLPELALQAIYACFGLGALLGLRSLADRQA